MKKLLISIIAICTAFCCIGCSIDDSSDKMTPTSDIVPITEDINNESSEPPCVLVFNSFEEIAELKDMLNEDEDIVLDYLTSNNYDMNGLSSKNDIAKLFDDIGDTNMFHMDSSSGYHLHSMLYYVSYNYIMSTYTNDHDFIRFICYIGTTDEKNTLNKTESEKEVVSTLSIGNKTVPLYRVEEKNSSYSLVGRTQTDNSMINIFLFEENVTVLRNSIDKNIISLTLLDLIEN